MRSFCGSPRSSQFALLCVFLAATSAFAADHRDAPAITGGEEKQDINDVYVFQSPSNPNNAVFIATLNPFIGMFAQDGTLDPNTAYDLKIDTNGDAVEDIVYTWFFSTPNMLGQQNFILQSGRSVLARGRTGVPVNVSGGGKTQVSIQDDPFFFDLDVVPDTTPGNPDPNTDTFAGFNITAIILEVPRRNLRVDNIGCWFATELRGRQVDRMGRPAINTVLIPDGRNSLPDRRDEFNAAEPSDDMADFFDDAASTLVADFGIAQGTAEGLADALLPDVLTVNLASANGFGPEGAPNLNGRRLEDDVIDVELQLITGNPMASDGVDSNDKAFSTTFPYIASPHP